VLVGLQVVQQGWGRGRGAVVECQTPGVGSSASCNIVGGASLAGPVTPR
jgi:hypothetical protein